MGSKLAKSLDDPSNEKLAKQVFDHYDKDKSGGLSKDEWINFGKDVFEIDKKNTQKEMKKQLGFLGRYNSILF